MIYQSQGVTDLASEGDITVIVPSRFNQGALKVALLYDNRPAGAVLSGSIDVHVDLRHATTLQRKAIAAEGLWQ